MMSIKIKRIYEEPSEDDGYRVLTDRLWPRGVSKEAAHLDEWNKEVAPSSELRKWFNHQEEKFEEFVVLYREELFMKEAELNRIRDVARNENVTLLFAARNPNVNHTLVLKEVLLHG